MHQRRMNGWLLAAWLLATPAAAHEAMDLPDLTVQGQRDTSRLTLGTSATSLPTRVDTLDAQTLARLPVGHVLDMLRTVPGAITGAIDQGDVGNDLGLRGFSGGHGREAAVFVDGVPMNVRNGRAHGLVDLTWLQPEMVERIEIIKGPFSAFYGDFALGGAVNIITKSTSESAVSATAGRFGTVRTAAAGDRTIGDWTLLGFAEAWHTDGYRDNSDGDRLSAFGKATRALLDGQLSASALMSQREFGAPGYLPVADVIAGRDPRDALNRSDGGRADVARVTLGYQGQQPTGWRMTSYAGNDRRDRYATFTDGGNQNHDRTQRDYAGLRGWHQWVAGVWSLAVGLESQFDSGERTRFGTDGNRRDQAVVRDRRTDVLATGVFSQAQWQPVSRVLVTAGLRYDRFDTDVDNRVTPENSGDGAPAIVSPKLGVTWQAVRTVELFASAGQGFRSPSAEELSPDGGSTSFDSLDPLQLDSADAGLRWRPTEALTFDVAVYRTETEGEIVQTGGADEFVNIGATTRNGYELAVDWRPTPLARLFASATGVNARTDDGDAVTGIPDDSQVLGAEALSAWAGYGLALSGYLQRFGETPLTADASMIRPALTRIASEVTASRGPWQTSLSLIYLPDRFASESQFGFAGGVYSPKPELDVQLGVRYQFL